MKKVLVFNVVLGIAGIMSVAILAVSVLQSGAARPPVGDLNGDGVLTPQDALLVFNCYLGRVSCSAQADINQDGSVTPEDALCLFKKYLGQPSCLDGGGTPGGNGKAKVDDWQEEWTSNSSGGGYTPFFPAMYGIAAGGAMASSSSIGLSTGGAKDINNFRSNIKNGYLPIPSDVTYEGLFYDYYFDTGQQGECQKLFCPSYSMAVSRDIFSEKEDYYLSVGLNSGIEAGDFQRKKLNLVIVLDISGSMGSSFDSYYYDRFGVWHEIKESESVGKSKIRVATESIAALIDHLKDDDRFGMVCFDDRAYLSKPLRLVGETDMQAIKDHVMELTSRGGTNMSAGMKKGTELFNEYLDIDHSQYENRIIFLTDAMPNTEDTSETGLLGMAKKNANNKVYSTFIGIGVDFNTELVEYITKVRGANYYSVHSSAQFKEQMDENFDYMVTPLVFNLELRLEASGYEIAKVYGSPEANEATGEIMKVNTLFPSSKTEEGTRGGVVLLKLKKIANDAGIKLTVSYEDREGKTDRVSEEIVFGSQEQEFFANTGVRKAVLLSSYADLLKNWIIDERKSKARHEPVVPAVTYEKGIVIPIPCPCPTLLGEWERQSVNLTVSREYKQLFKEFAEHFKDEMKAIGDETLQQEVDVLEKLSLY
ncbi:MAG: VWA domain-containing protein [bacterium]